MPRKSALRRGLYNVVDTLILLICLPFYAVFIPLFTLSEMRKAKELAKRECPHCGEIMTGLDRRTFECVSARISLAENAIVDWGRLPRTKLRCPKCGESFCIDNHWRVTSCSHGDHIHEREKP